MLLVLTLITVNWLNYMGKIKKPLEKYDIALLNAQELKRIK